MTALLSIMGTRAGGFATLVMIGLLTVAAGGLGLSLWIARSDLTAAQGKAARLEAAVAEQNAAIERMKAEALAASQAASTRALAALKPRPKPNTATIEELNTWFDSP
ncbi:hypothetical protein [Azospirillum sp. B2RO_4]|uniref:hypothetical protein n=1 Tax=Azospirillum sp. B2RO_4 TaxID=3027796 RepID=UPI003DA906AB